MELLEQLTQTPGVPGRERLIRSVIETHLRQNCLVDEIRTDTLGSLIGIRRARPSNPAPAGRPPLRVMVAAHMDQIGFLVSHISATGHLRLHPVGAFDPRTLFARRVAVCNEAGELIPGVLQPTGRPIHTAGPEELRKIPEIADFVVDLGMAADTVRANVQLGNMICLNGPFFRAGNFVVAPGMDDRAGCWAIIRALERLNLHNCEIFAVWTAQEELGSRGAGTVSFDIRPDIGIACDTTVCCDTPGVPEEQAVTRAGLGVSIQIADSSMIADQELVADLERAAQSRGIPHQRSLMVGGGQDGCLIQRSRSGTRTAVLSCPVRHLHTVTEMVHVDDLWSYRDLLVAYLESL